MTLVAALDNMPLNLVVATPEDLAKLAKDLYALEGEHDKEEVGRMLRIWERLAVSWIKRKGKLQKVRKVKKEKENEDDESEYETEEIPERDADAYLRELVFLGGVIQTMDAVAGRELKRVRGHIRLINTPIEELKADKRGPKKGADAPVMDKQVLDAIRTLQKFKLAPATAPKDDKKKRKRPRRPRGKKESDAEGEGEKEVDAAA